MYFRHVQHVQLPELGEREFKRWPLKDATDKEVPLFAHISLAKPSHMAIAPLEVGGRVVRDASLKRQYLVQETKRVNESLKDFQGESGRQKEPQKRALLWELTWCIYNHEDH